MDAPDYV